MNALQKCLKVNIIWKALKALSKDLDAINDRILNSIKEDYQKKTFSVLQWLAFFTHSMQLEEITEVTSMTDENYPVFKSEKQLSEPIDVLTICISLVTQIKRKKNYWESNTVTEL